MEKYIKVVASFYYRMDSEDINMDKVNIQAVQDEVLRGLSCIRFDISDGDSCVINSVEIL
jgi:hypothetical protein